MTSTFVISLQTLLEEAQADMHARKLTGNITGEIEDLFTEENIKALRQTFQGIFAFLAFHPEVDKGVTSYVLSGSLSSDSGHDLLVLFVLNTSATSPTLLEDHSLKSWLAIDDKVHPSYTLIKSMFKDPVALHLPGVIFFEDPLQEENPVYIHISNAAEENAVRQQMRQLFAIAEKSYHNSLLHSRGFLDFFAQSLLKEHIDYERGRDISTREWFIRALRFIHARSGDIVSIINLFK